MQIGLEIFFLNLTPIPIPKIASKGPKNVKKAPNLAKLKTKRQSFTSKTKINIIHQQTQQMCFEPVLDPKNSPKWPMKQPQRARNCDKSGQKCGQFKNKKMKLIVYIGRPKKVFDPDPNPPKTPQKGPKSTKKAPNLANFKTKIQGCTSKTKIDSLHQQA